MDTMEVEENGAPDAEGSPGAGADAGADGSPAAEPKKEIYAAAVAMDVDGGGEAEAADEELPVAAGEAVPPDEAPAEEAASTADAPAATPAAPPAAKAPAKLFDVTLPFKGKDVPLSKFRGDAHLVVNIKMDDPVAGANFNAMRYAAKEYPGQ